MTRRYMKLFKMLLNTAVLNSLIIFKQNTGRHCEQLDFRIQLVESLFTTFASVRGKNVPGSRPSDNTVPRLTERHFIRRVTPKNARSRPQRWCVVCIKHGRKKNISFYCYQECDVGLCVEECFELSHTKLNY